MKIVMTLLVRDEQDIIRQNIEFHLNQGVDFLIATDNNSEDRTVEILREYEKQGLLFYISETEDDYNQSAWVTRMARMAHERYGADWVINNDADEFWFPVEGNLKETFTEIPPEFEIVRAQRSDFVMHLETNDQIPFHDSMVYRKTVSHNALGKPLPPKVAHKGTSDVIVAQGNHSVSGLNSRAVLDDVIDILHFPLRTCEQFENKIVKGGAAYARNQTLPESIGNTWRMLYGKYLQEGNLNEVFKDSVYDKQMLENGLKSGELVLDERLSDYLKACVKLA